MDVYDGIGFLSIHPIFISEEENLKIDSYQIGMESERLYKSYQGSRRFVSADGGSASTGSPLSSFTDMLNDNQACEEEGKGEKAEASYPENTVEKAMRDLSARSSMLTRVSRSDSAASSFQELHQLLIKHILDLLFGKKIKDLDTESMAAATGSSGYQIVTVSTVNEEIYHEQEAFSFDASGVVKTADGREIDISLSIGMSREFTSYYAETTKQEIMQVCDPLVINLDNAPASLSDMKFYFDLDTDGVEEEISYLNSGSGYLALDKNEDGIINDGSELFGTQSGDGFKDLVAYDSDNNGWIDENDEIFDKLKIWVTNADGNSTLYSLKEKDVGAIYLGSVNTQFSLNSSLDNSVNGYIRKTGLFLYETGMPGSLQHVDLVS